MWQKVRLSAGCPARINFELLVHENEMNKLTNTFFCCCSGNNSICEAGCFRTARGLCHFLQFIAVLLSHFTSSQSYLPKIG
jgi:hypothetical protein